MAPSDYRIPARDGSGLIETKGSRFYARAASVRDELEVQSFLQATREGRAEANHHAFAYRLGPTGARTRFRDDGEPGGTAGRPIMEILLRADLVDVAVVVSRHFGGTLLGAGGLARAYGGAAALAVREAGVTVLRPHARLRVTIDYGLLGAVEQEIRRLGLRAPEAAYDADVTLTISVPIGTVDDIRVRLANLSAGSARVAADDTVFL